MLLLLFLVSGAKAQGGMGLPSLSNACLPQYRLRDPLGCRNLMVAAAQDPNLYWFGNYYARTCATGSVERNASCLNALPPGGTAHMYRTLVSRLFADPNYPVDAMFAFATERIDVIYRSPMGQRLKGYLTGCNSSQYVKRAVMFDANPSMQPINAFFTKNPPEVRTSVCNPRQLCTLVLYDAAVGVLHNIFGNWPRDDPKLSTYLRPGNPRLEANTYVWLVYKQKPGVDVPSSQRVLNYTVRLTDLQLQYGLTGPVAITWMLVSGDLFAADNFNRAFPNGGYAITCPSLLESRLLDDSGQIYSDLGIPVYRRMLDYWLGVAFPTAIYGTAYADSLQNAPLSGLIRQPSLFLVPRRAPPLPQDLQGHMMTVVMGSPAGGLSNGHVILNLYWMEVDAPADNLAAGNVLVPYADPATIPLSSRRCSQIYVLMMEQKGSILNPTTFLDQTCVPAVAKRCRFDLTNFLNINGLHISALARFRTVRLAFHNPPFTDGISSTNKIECFV